MRKISHYYYECEFCGSRYETEEEAKICENFHKKPIKLVETGFKYYSPYSLYDDDCYTPKDLNCYGFPGKIEVEDDSGNRACYQYKSIVEVNKND